MAVRYTYTSIMSVVGRSSGFRKVTPIIMLRSPFSMPPMPSSVIRMIDGISIGTVILVIICHLEAPSIFAAS
ncbi:hypothetical protein D3C84_1296210 [compost metagenome]